MTLAWDSLGAGPPVLLVHSMACDRRMWDPQTPPAGRRRLPGDPL